MAETITAAGLKVQQWDDNFFENYVGSNRFSRYMGPHEGAIIQTKENLTKSQGDRVTFALINELDASGITGTTGNGVLEGNEEALDTRSHAVAVDVLRHAVLVTDWEEQKSAVGLRNAAKTRLSNWAMKRLRNDIITALGSIDGVDYGIASAVQKNGWQMNNTDRVLFGAAMANNTGVHSTSLSTVDAVADTLSPGMISLAKRLAQQATPALRPVITKGDEEWFVLFCHSRAFRDLKNDPAMLQANRDGWTRGQDNPLFTGGDLIWDGVIIKEIPEITAITGVGTPTGAAGTEIDVAPNYLCGAQAVGTAWAQRSRTATQDTDYTFRHGVAVQEIRGVEKLRFGTGVNDTDTPKDHGVLTLFTAGVADS